MTEGDRGLQLVRAATARQGVGPIEQRRPAGDRRAIPPPTILIGEQHGIPVDIDAGGEARGLQLHERRQAERLRLPREESVHEAPQPERLVRELGAQHRVAPLAEYPSVKIR